MDKNASLESFIADIPVASLVQDVSIGCATGSSVSSQMYFNQLMVFASGNDNNLQAGVYDPTATTIPIAYVPTQIYPGAPMKCLFSFQGTNGNTNIQPIGP